MQLRAPAALLLTACLACSGTPSPPDTAETSADRITSYTVNLSTQNLAFYRYDEKGAVLGSIGRLKTYVEKKGKKLVFAMNGGMYREDLKPCGLYIEEYKTLYPLNRSSGDGNFHLKPNGVFYLDKKGKAYVCTTEKFIASKDIRFATQSGPMLVIDGNIHPAFGKGSANTNIRNGVGILPNGNVVFAISKEPVNLYDFAAFFKALGCKNALYLDGYVSRMYLPEKGYAQLDGGFGVMIAVVK